MCLLVFYCRRENVALNYNSGSLAGMNRTLIIYTHSRTFFFQVTLHTSLHEQKNRAVRKEEKTKVKTWSALSPEASDFSSFLLTHESQMQRGRR